MVRAISMLRFVGGLLGKGGIGRCMTAPFGDRGIVNHDHSSPGDGGNEINNVIQAGDGSDLRDIIRHEDGDVSVDVGAGVVDSVGVISRTGTTRITGEGETSVVISPGRFFSGPGGDHPNSELIIEDCVLDFDNAASDGRLLRFSNGEWGRVRLKNVVVRNIDLSDQTFGTAFLWAVTDNEIHDVEFVDCRFEYDTVTNRTGEKYKVVETTSTNSIRRLRVEETDHVGELADPSTRSQVDFFNGYSVRVSEYGVVRGCTFRKWDQYPVELRGTTETSVVSVSDSHAYDGHGDMFNSGGKGHVVFDNCSCIEEGRYGSDRAFIVSSSDVPRSVTVHNCTVEDWLFGIEISTGARISITDNVLVNIGSDTSPREGIQVRDNRRSSIEISDVRISDNTIVNEQSSSKVLRNGIQLVEADDQWTGTATVTNNIVVGEDQSKLDVDDSIPVTRSKSDWADVASYGAAGDGSTNDTDAIQFALDNHERVYFPPGTYRVDKLTHGSDVTLEFEDGAKLEARAKDLDTTNVIVIQAEGTNSSPVSGVTYINPTIDVRKSAHSGTAGNTNEGIDWAFVEDSVIYEPDVSNSPSEGIDLDDCRGCIVYGGSVTNNDGSGVHISNGCENTWGVGIFAEGNGGGHGRNGLDVWNGTNGCGYAFCHAFSNNIGFDFKGSDACGVGLRAESNDNQGIRFGSSGGVLSASHSVGNTSNNIEAYSGSTLQSPVSKNAGDVGIYVTSDNVTVHSPRVDGSTNENMRTTSGSSDLQVTNPNLTGGGRGLVLNGPTPTVIGGRVTGSGEWGVAVHSDAADAVLQSVSSTGHTSSDIRIRVDDVNLYNCEWGDISDGGSRTRYNGTVELGSSPTASNYDATDAGVEILDTSTSPTDVYKVAQDGSLIGPV